MVNWFRNIYIAVATVSHALWVGSSLLDSYLRPERRTFTEKYEFPELPVAVAPRFRGYHRFDLTTCIACEACTRACPANCIEIGKQKGAGKERLPIN